jgi:hypothetical protein
MILFYYTGQIKNLNENVYQLIVDFTPLNIVNIVNIFIYF